jgi:hypothetical protein
MPFNQRVGRPFGVMKFESLAPRERAVWFMICANPGTEPPMFSAMTTLASLADFISSACSRSRLV